MKQPLFKLFMLTAAIGLAQTSFAGSLVQIDNEVRQTLDTLKFRGVISIDTSTWPISSEAIDSALQAAKPRAPEDTRLIDGLKQKIHQSNNVNFQLVSNVNGDKRAVYSTFDKDYDTNTPLGLSASYSNQTQHLDYKLQATANLDETDTSRKTNFDGSYVGTKLGNHRLAVGAIPVWWGNGVDGSLIRSNAARPVVGALVQRADPKPINLPVLSKLGNFNYQITAGQLQDYTSVPDTKLIGMRASFQPNDMFQIGASRMIMWGGEGREESLKSLGRALTGKYDNGGYGEDPSNQIAGIDAQVNLRPLINIPASVYGEFIGEDEAGGLPAKKAYLAGIKGYLPIMNQPWLWHAEWANTHYDFDKDGIIYAHSIYRDGYYQKGLPLGHPIGGDGEIISVGLSGHIDPSNQLSVNYANAKVNQSEQRINAAFPTKQNLNILGADWEHRYNANTSVKLGVWGQKDSVSDNSDIGGNLVFNYGY